MLLGFAYFTASAFLGSKLCKRGLGGEVRFASMGDFWKFMSGNSGNRAGKQESEMSSEVERIALQFQ